MLKSVLNRNIVLACLADCAAAVPFGRNLRTITHARSHSFYTRRCMQLLIAKGLFLKVLGGCYLDPGMGRIRTYLWVASPSIVAMRSWRVFWDFPNVITLHILEIKVVDLTDTVYGSNPLISSHSRIRFK